MPYREGEADEGAAPAGNSLEPTYLARSTLARREPRVITISKRQRRSVLMAGLWRHTRNTVAQGVQSRNPAFATPDMANIAKEP